ncbi:MAG: glycosyl hydrolase 115 family protein, partial [Butyrivibrio sp.]|nr:glycosyl hydrolase 115 family protein [Butyrivibrio sp.]
NVIQTQRRIISSVLEKEEDEPLQVFIPYKEVLPLYDKGLNVPDDITLMWVDDNFGYVRRYPDVREKKRSGGNALYYHNSYWAHPGMSYLFINTIPMAQTGLELARCYEQCIRKIWVLNVGALKPLEQDIEYFLTCAWDAGRKDSVTYDPDRFLAGFVDRNYSCDIGPKTSKIYSEFARIANLCKVEHLRERVFSQSSYGDEAGIRLFKLKELYDCMKALEERLPEDERESFFELFTFKLGAAFYKNAEFYYADRSLDCIEHGKNSSADIYVDEADKMKNLLRKILYYYNKVLSNGKWDRIVTPEAFPPPCFPMYPASKRSLRIGDAHLGVRLWGDLDAITFEEYGEHTKWVEIFNLGSGSINYDISFDKEDAPFDISEENGKFLGEKRILIRPQKQAFTEEKSYKLIVSEKALGETKEIPMDIVLPDYGEKEPYGEPEADGCVVIEATDFVMAKSSYEHIDSVQGLGRMYGDLVCSDIDSSQKELVYEFCLYSQGSFTMELSRYLTLSSKGRIRFEVQIDDKAPQKLESDSVDEWLGSWRESVLNDGEKLYLKLPFLEKGNHVLRLKLIDPYISFDRIVIYTTDKRTNDIAPFCSRFANKDTYYDIPLWTKEELIYERCEKQLTNVTEEELLPKLIFAGKDFWKKDLLYMRNEEQPQHIGTCRYAHKAGFAKDIISDFGIGAVAEKNGRIFIESEYALKMDDDSYISGCDGRLVWDYIKSESDGDSGFAMRTVLNPAGREGKLGELHYKFRILEGGIYNIWLLMKFGDDRSDTCLIGIDGDYMPASEQYSKGHPFTYSTQQIWFWGLVQSTQIDEGEHVLDVMAQKPDFRLDRIYLTNKDDN